MNRVAAGAVAAVVLLAVVAGGVLVGGFSPGEALGGPSDSDRTAAPGDIETTTDATGATTGRTADVTDTSDATADGGIDSPTTTADGDADAGEGYDFTIERVEECGTTCRNVTARLANAGASAREDVRVTTRVYADGDLLWHGNETVGRLEPGEAHASTRRVELGLGGAMAIQGNDGYVTIVTVVRSADGTERFEDRRKVG